MGNRSKGPFLSETFSSCSPLLPGSGGGGGAEKGGGRRAGATLRKRIASQAGAGGCRASARGRCACAEPRGGALRRPGCLDTSVQQSLPRLLPGCGLQGQLALTFRGARGGAGESPGRPPGPREAGLLARRQARGPGPATNPGPPSGLQIRGRQGGPVPERPRPEAHGPVLPLHAAHPDSSQPGPGLRRAMPLPDTMFCAQQIHIPPELPDILKQFTKAAIRTQPADVLQWSAG